MCLDTAVLITGIVRHVDIALTNSLTLDTTEIDGLLLRLCFTISIIENPYTVSKCSSATSQTARAAGEELYKSILLQYLTSEDVNGDFSGSINYFIAALVSSLNLHSMEVGIYHGILFTDYAWENPYA